MRTTILPYIPDVQKLFQTFDSAISRRPEEGDSANEYMTFLRQYRLLSLEGGIYVPRKEHIGWSTKDNGERLAGFRDFIFKNIPLVQALYSRVEKQSQKVEDLQDALKSEYTGQDIRVVLSWLEYMNLIRYQDDNISLVLNESEYDSYADSGSIYPLNYHTEIDISEEYYSIFEYARKLTKGDIILNPEFQRKLVWKLQQKSQFIESAILNIPIPPIYLKKNNEGKLIVVDGLQRTSAVMSFLQDGFALDGLEALHELNGYTFSDLQRSEEYKALAARIEDKRMLFFVLKPSVPMPLVYDIFNRINTGGTKLERQEIRNCIFIGKSTELLRELAESDVFRKAIDGGISAQRMKDREAVLRCIAFTLQDFQKEYTTMDDFLENAMKRLNKESAVVIEDIKREFLEIMDWSYRIFGERNFRIPTETTRGRINIAVMETVYYCLFLLKKQQSEGTKILFRQFLKLVRDEDFQKAVRLATGNRTYVVQRFEMAKRCLLGL